jgi:hypothetical protein
MTIRFPSRAPLPAADVAAVEAEVVPTQVVLLLQADLLRQQQVRLRQQQVRLRQRQVRLRQRQVRLRPVLLPLEAVPGDEAVADVAAVEAVAARW